MLPDRVVNPSSADSDSTELTAFQNAVSHLKTITIENRRTSSDGRFRGEVILIATAMCHRGSLFARLSRP